MIADEIMTGLGMPGQGVRFTWRTSWPTRSWRSPATPRSGGSPSFGGAGSPRSRPRTRPRGSTRRHVMTLAVIVGLIAGVTAFGAQFGMAAFAGSALLTLAGAADEKAAIKSMPWGVMLMVCGVTVLTNVLEKTGGLDLFTTLLSRFSTRGTVAGVIAFVTGLVSVFSSTSGVVLPTFLRACPGSSRNWAAGTPWRSRRRSSSVGTWSTSRRSRPSAPSASRARALGRPAAPVQQGPGLGAGDVLRRRGLLSIGVRGFAMTGASISTRVSTLRPTAVNRVLAEVKALQASGRDLVSLMRGQPDTPTPGHVVEAAVKALRDGRTGYPDNLGEPA